WSVHSNISLILAGAILLYTAWDKGPVRRLVRRGRSLIVALLIGWAAITAFYVLDLPVSPHSSAVWSPKEEPEMGGIFGQAFSSSRWTSGLDTRKAIWLNTLEIVRHHPWLGTGVGTFTWVYPATISPIVQNDEALSAWSGSWTNAAHQELLQTWAELGIVGAALLVVMVSLSIRLYWTRLRGGASGATSVLLAVGIAGLVAILFQCQMNFPLRMPTGTFHFFLFLVIPLLLPRSAGESWDLDVPVERPYGPFNVGIMMRNMAYPTELSLRISLESLPARALAAVVLALGLVLLVPISAPLRADLAYRQVRETKLRAGQGVGSIDRVIPLADKVLAVWPGHVDCRSARQDALLATGKFQEVIDETPLVLEKLNAVEVRLRRALALDALGKTGESTEDWREVFRRRPELAVQFPEPWQRVRPATTSSK
ncbi:hypothetical protein GC173_07415, partial [bacterium]|nr:hypothetical protein [bacterium]